MLCAIAPFSYTPFFCTILDEDDDGDSPSSPTSTQRSSGEPKHADRVIAEYREELFSGELYLLILYFFMLIFRH